MDTDQSGYLPQNPSLSQPSHVSDVANKTAKTAVPIHPHLANRWTPRGFDRIHNVSDDELRALLEAARWTASCANTQPALPRPLMQRVGRVAARESGTPSQ